jgi:hypothetical protein
MAITPTREPQALDAQPDPGHLPAWGRAELPAPPPFSLKNAWKLIGAATIALGISIGSGEWLLGPAVTARYGAALLWVASVSIILQTILNQEMIRYTVATGEPIFTGIMRTRPGPKFWGPVYSVLLFFQVGWPGWAITAATAITAAFKGSLPTADDKPTVLAWGYATFIIALVIIAMGNKVVKTLEYAQWFMVGWILIFLLVIGIFFTSGRAWAMVWGGFLGLGGNPIPEGGDWLLLASFAAYAGLGGLSNGTITNWVRDKGWGMASTTGYIPALIGGHKVNLTRVGNTFLLTPESLARFNEWMRYVRFEQNLVFALGCLLGMGLPALMTVQFVPAGTDMAGGWAAAVHQANGIARAFGSLAWFLTLLNGFWILFSTQLGVIDIFSRTVTDIAWSSNSRIRALVKGDVRKVYYTLLVIHAAFGMWAINQAQPFTLIVIGAFIAGSNFVLLGLHTIAVQRRFLPAELRMPLWRLIAIAVMILMFGAFTLLGIQSRWQDILKIFGLV